MRGYIRNNCFYSLENIRQAYVWGSTCDGYRVRLVYTDGFADDIKTTDKKNAEEIFSEICSLLKK